MIDILRVMLIEDHIDFRPSYIEIKKEKEKKNREREVEGERERTMTNCAYQRA